MKLSQVIKDTGAVILHGTPGTEITSICSDSRKAVPGSLFIAVKGCSIDGHDYIDAAINAGGLSHVGIGFIDQFLAIQFA